MDRDILFLFGAGASAFSDEQNPNPPLGKDLFSLLEESDSLDINEKTKAIFREDFENGMNSLADESQSYNPIQISLAKYLSQFKPSKTNLYVQLIQKIKELEVINRIIFSTINYDLLIEESSKICGIKNYEYGSYSPELSHLKGVASVAIFTTPQTFNKMLNNIFLDKSCIPLLKLHGSVNFLPNLGSLKISGCKFSNNNSDIACNVEIANGMDAVNNWINSRCGDVSIAPAMSLYRGDKKNPSNKWVVDGIQKKWIDALKQAKRVYLVGVKYNALDEHIWSGILESKNICEIIDVDPVCSKVFLRSNLSDNCNYTHVSKTFKEYLPEIFNDLSANFATNH